MTTENYIDFGSHKVLNNLFVETWESVKPNKVIVSVPHDVKPNYTWPDTLRTNGVVRGDPGAWLIAKDLMFNNLYPVCKSISVVRANIPRGVVDLNRSWPEPKSYYKNTEPEIAIDDPKYAPVYHHYYSEITRLITRGISVFGKDKILMVDLHGFSKQSEYAPAKGYDLVLGTGNRKTIFYEDIDIRLGEYLQSLGYEVFVPSSSPKDGRQEDVYSAEHITRSFAERFNVNAIQIEVAKKYRDKKLGREIGPKLSHDLTIFLNEI